MAKCAELGVPDAESRLLLKHAAFTRDEALQRMQEARDAVAGEEGLDVGDSGLPGTWLGRTIRRPLMSPESFASYYDAHTAGKVRQARDAAAGGADSQSYGNYGRVQPPPSGYVPPAGGIAQAVQRTDTVQPPPAGSVRPAGESEIDASMLARHAEPRVTPQEIDRIVGAIKANRRVPAAEGLSGAALSNAEDQEARSAAFSSGLASGNLDTSYLPSRHFTTR